MDWGDKILVIPCFGNARRGGRGLPGVEGL